MTTLPAYCSNCSSVFPFKGIHVSGPGTVQLSMWNNTVNCPVCGNPKAVISEGIFNVTNETIEIVSAPEITRAMLAALKKISEQAATAEISEEQALKQARAISPRYAGVLEKAFKFGLPTVALLATIINGYITYEGQKASAISSEKLLSAVTEQTYEIKNIKNKLQEFQHEHEDRIQKQRANPPEIKANDEATTDKRKSSAARKLTTCAERL